MPLSTIIRQFNTDVPFKMEVYFDKQKDTYVLSFTSMRDSVRHGEEHAYTTFEEAQDRFISNCRYYHVPVPVKQTEEEFLGIHKGTLYPASLSYRASFAARSFNYLTAKSQEVNNARR